MHFIYLCAIHLLKFIYLIIYKYRHTAINTTSASQKLPLAPLHPPLLFLISTTCCLGTLCCSIGFRFSLAVERRLPRPPALPTPIPFTSSWRAAVPCPVAGASPHRPPLLCQWASQAPHPGMLGLPSTRKTSWSLKDSSALSLPFLPAAECVLLCPRELVRGDGSSGGDGAEPPGPDTPVCSHTTVSSPSPNTQLS